MKKISASVVLFLFSVSLFAQDSKDFAFSVSFKYATTKWGCVEMNVNLSYFPKYRTFVMDSNEADAISQYVIEGFKETRGTVKVFTDGGRFEFEKNNKGEFVSCTFISKDLDYKVVYSNAKMKPLIEDKNLIVKQK